MFATTPVTATTTTTSTSERLSFASPSSSSSSSVAVPRSHVLSAKSRPQRRQRRRSVGGANATAQKEESDVDFFTTNDALARRLPLYFGSASLVLLLVNRVFSNVAPTLNAASSQSRADVIDVVMSATLILTGLTLVSIAPRIPETVVMDGYAVNYEDSGLSERCKEELRWCGKTLREASKCASVTVVEIDGEKSTGKVVFYDGTCCAKDPRALFENRSRQIGSVCKEVLTSGKQNYMANANLFPGRFEFIQDDQEMLFLKNGTRDNTEATTNENDDDDDAGTKMNISNYSKGFGLPQNSQAICCVAIGDERLIVLSADRQRGFTKVDQSWFELVAQKLDNAFLSQ
jgi:hypothetical protein